MTYFNKQLFHELLIEHSYKLTNGGSTFYFLKKIQDRTYFVYDHQLTITLKVLIPEKEKEFKYATIYSFSPEKFLKESKQYKKRYNICKFPENLFYLEISKITYMMYRCRLPNSIKFILDKNENGK